MLSPFSGLLDIMDTVRFCPEADHILLLRISQAAEELGVQDKFVVTLLHTHFLLSEDEMIVEEIDIDKRTIYKKAVKKSTITGYSFPMNWRLEERGCIALEHSVSSSEYDEPILTKRDFLFFERVSGILAETKQLNRFGLAMVPSKLFDPRQEILLEDSDLEQRLLESKVYRSEYASESSSIETAWILRSDHFITAARCRERSASRCSYRCNSYYSGYIENHSRGHYVDYYTVHAKV